VSEPRTVLVVEDNRDIAELLGQLLKAYGCEVLAAENVGAVERTLAGRRVDLILLDILLPEEAEDGRKIAKRLRDAGHKVPIYFMTGLRPPDIGKEYMGLVDGFLRKPFSLRDLRQLLQQALGWTVPEEAAAPACDLMGMMASIATEQEEIRRQQARLASFMTILQGGKGQPPSPADLAGFTADSMRYEESLVRIEKALGEIQDLLRRHRTDLLTPPRRGVRAAE
jgi:CheY-like chemotaxis protein